MSKVALISDIHFGVRRNNDLFLESQLRFFRNQFIPELNNEKVKDIFILGDTMDNRNSVNVRVLSEVYSLFKNDLKDFNIKMITGNHDIYFKNTTKINSVEYLEALPNVEVYSDIKLINYDNKKILLVPWIVDEEDFKKRVSNKNLGCDYCFGHFEIKGFHMTKTNICEGGLDPLFIANNYGKTFSGHFHKRSIKEFSGSTIQYLGAPCQYTRNDIGEDMGFAILDIPTGDYKFINNTTSIQFYELKYPEKFDEKKIKGNIIDVIVEYDDNYNDSLVQKYLQIVNKYEPAMPANIKMINKNLNNDDIEIKAQSIEDLMKEYIETLDISDKDIILNKVVEIYKECSRGN